MTIAFNSTTESGFIKNDFDQISAYLSGADDSTTLETRLDTLATTSDLDNVHDNLTIDRNGANKLQIKDLSITNDKISNQTIEDTKLNFGTLVKLYDWTATSAGTTQSFNIPNIYSGRIHVNLVAHTTATTNFTGGFRLNNISTNTYRNNFFGVNLSGTAVQGSSWYNAVDLGGAYTGSNSYSTVDFSIKGKYFFAIVTNLRKTSGTPTFTQELNVLESATDIVPATLDFVYTNNYGVGTNIKIYKYT